MGRSRRKGRRITMPNKKNSSKRARVVVFEAMFGPTEDQPDRPTEAEWNSMEPAATRDTGKHIFRRGNDVRIHSIDGPDNKWIGRLCSMRRRGRPDGSDDSDGSDTWALVQWYFSLADLKELPTLKHNYQIDSISRNERVLSDTKDLIPVNSLQSVIYVHRYNEESIDPPELHPQRDYFVRRSVAGTYCRPLFSPLPGQDTCICAFPYNPFPEDFSLAELATRKYYNGQLQSRSPTEIERMGDYMHFCPRPSCSKWFHESCLRHASSKHAQHSDFIAAPEVQRLAVDPDHNLPYPTLAQFAYAKPARGKMSNAAPYTLDEVLNQITKGDDLPLPQSLIRIATMPIIRRAGEPKFSTAGNVTDVVLARRMVYQALDGWHTELDRLMKRLDDDWYLHGGPACWERVWRFLCSVRILASPSVSYWDRRCADLEMRADRPLLHCPECDGVPVAI